MAEQNEQEQGSRPVRRRRGEPVSWGRFWWKDWVGTASIRLLTRDQRGGLADVRAFTYGTSTPGVMTEDEVRIWAGYSPEDWKKNRDAFARVFNLKRRKGKWVLDDIVRDHEATLRAMKVGHERAMKAVAGRRKGKDLATTSATPGAQQVPPQVQLGLDKTLDSEKRLETTDQPEAEARAARAQNARSRAGSAGTAGSSSPSRLEPIVARALEGKPALRPGSA